MHCEDNAGEVGKYKWIFMGEEKPKKSVMHREI